MTTENRDPTEASRSSFAGDLTGVLFRPAAFWEGKRESKATIRSLLWPHLIVLVGLRALAGFAGSVLSGVGIIGSVGRLLSSFLAWFLMVWLFGAIVGSIAAARGARMAPRDALRFAVWGLTPLFVVGILAVVPLPHVSPVADLVMMPHAFYVLAGGVVPVLGVPADRAPGAVDLVCGVLLVLWTVMPTLTPVVVAALVR